jgi:preprotein translocase subunit SecE
MNPKSETHTSRLDTYKWLLAILIVLAALVAFYYFADILLAIRVAGLLVAATGAVLIVLRTELGGGVLEFTRDARMELRKVVWPTRAETMQTGLAVIVMVVVMGVLLWLLDVLLFWLVRLLTGQGG